MSVNSNALLKQKIKKNLSRITESKLKEIDDFIDFLLNKEEIEEAKPANLEGIWKNSGFENIPDLEQSLSDARKELSDSILKRKVL